jgi:hypothetical protein
MPRLSDVTSMIRSKNAGPFWITIDIIFSDIELYRRWVGDDALALSSVAKLYARADSQVIRYECAAAAALKFSFERRHASGSRLDSDVFGCQQHAPIVGIELGEPSRPSRPSRPSPPSRPSRPSPPSREHEESM